MNIIFISDDPREADLLKHELAGQAPAIRLDASPNAQDAMARLTASVPCDVILLDASVPIPDAIDLAAAIRQAKKPIGIVSLVSTTDKNPPVDLLKAGVDNFVLKRAGFVSLLQDALTQAKDRRQTNPAPHARQLRLLFVGNDQMIRKQASGLPNVVVESVSFAPDGTLKLPETGTIQDEVLIIDCSESGANTLNTIREVNLRIPDLPIILLTNPGDDETAIRAMRAGASDCVAKTESCFHRLLPVIERENRRRELLRVRTALRSREERLRQIVETMPVGITVLASDGTFLAINRTGLKLVGAARLEQIIGKNFLQMLPLAEREKVENFLASVVKGNSASVRIDWKGLDETAPGIELRGVTMRRDNGGVSTVLAAIYPSGGNQAMPFAEEGSQQNSSDLEKALQEAEFRLREHQEKAGLQQARWAEDLRQAEARCAALEEQQAVLKRAAEEADGLYKKLLQEQATERTGWEQAREGLKEQSAKIESTAVSLRSAQESLLESHAADRARWEMRIQELEQKAQSMQAQKSTLEFAVRDAESLLAQHAETLAAERSKWEKARQDLEQKVRDAESVQETLQSVLGDAEGRLARQVDELTEEKVQWEALRRELEQKTEASEGLQRTIREALHNAEENLARQSEEHSTEKSDWDAVRHDLEQKAADAETQRAALESALHDSEARFNQQAETLAAERSQWDAVRHDLEQKAADAETQRATLESALHDSEARFNQQAEALAAERSQWDALRHDLEQKAADAETQRAALESALRDSEARFNQQAETLAAERSQWDAVRHDLEQKAADAETQRAALESALRDSEARFNQQAEALAAERSQWDALRHDLEQKAADAETQRAALESALRDAESLISRQAEDLKSERAQWDAIWLELEQKTQAAEAQQSKLESALRDSETRIAGQVEMLAAERSQWDVERQGLRSKVDETETRRASLESALRDAEGRITQQAEAHAAERAQWEAARLDLEQKHKETEAQRTSLQTALEEVESYLSQQTEEYASERSRWNLARLEMEQKHLGLEEQQGLLQNTLREMESALSSAVEEHGNEQTQWQSMRLELEQKCRSLENQLAEIKSAHQESESRAAGFAKEAQIQAETSDARLQQITELNTEVQRLEADLAAMQMRHQELSRFSSAGMVLTTFDGDVLSCNDAAAHMFGFAEYPESREQPLRLYSFEGALKSYLHKNGKLENVEWAALSRDNRLVRILENASIVPSSAGGQLCIERILSDISKTHPLSTEIRHVRRMESTAELAAATVKSLQDLWYSIEQCVARLRESADEEALVREISDTLLQASSRGIRHARQFFSVARKTTRTQELLDLNKALAENEGMLRNLAGEDIDLHIALPPRIGLVSVNGQELIQLISSLMASAREILPMGGTVSIQTSNVDVAPSAAGHLGELCPGTYVSITLTADGCMVHPERRIGSIQTLVKRIGGYLETAGGSQSENVYRVYLPRVEVLSAISPSI